MTWDFHDKIMIYIYIWDMHCALQILFGDGHFASATTLGSLQNINL